MPYDDIFQGLPQRKLSELISSTKKARDKQYPNNAIRAIDFKYSSQNKQLYIKAQATPWSNKNRRSPYSVSMVIDKVLEMPDTSKPSDIFVYYSNGVKIFLKRPTFNNTCRVRCQCEDFRYMWSYYDKTNKALIGTFIPYIRKTDNYPVKNPDKLPGLCKHLLALTDKLVSGKIIIDNANYLSSYLTSRKF